MWKQMVQIQVPSPNHLWVLIPNLNHWIWRAWIIIYGSLAFFYHYDKKNNKSSGLDDAMNILHSVKTIID